MSKRWEVVTYIVLTWIIVSSIFYTHHIMIVKTISIPGWDLNTKEDLVQVKEIRLFNKRLKTRIYEENAKGIRNVIWQSHWIPNKIRPFLVHIVNFYSWRYDTTDDNINNGWYMEISGGYLIPEFKESSETLDIDVTVDGTPVVTRGISSTEAIENNFRYFTARIEKVNPKVKNIEIKWKWMGHEDKEKYVGKFVTTHYSFFDYIFKEYDFFDPRKQ